MNKENNFINIGNVYFNPETSEVFDGLPGKLLGYGEITELKPNDEGIYSGTFNYYPTKDQLKNPAKLKQPTGTYA